MKLALNDIIDRLSLHVAGLDSLSGSTRTEALLDQIFKVIYTFDNLREERETKFGLFNEKSDIYVKFRPKSVYI